MAARVLFVDEEDWSVTPYFDKLRDQRIAVDHAMGVDEAIYSLGEKKYDLLILDIMMPPGKMIGLDVEPREAGVELLRKIRRNDLPDMKTSPAVPVIVLTAVTDQKILDALREFHVKELFQKPAKFDNLIDKVLSSLKINQGRSK